MKIKDKKTTGTKTMQRIKKIGFRIDPILMTYYYMKAGQTKAAINIGSKFRRMKRLVERVNKSWPEYLEKNYNFVATNESLENWMELSEWMSLKKSPLLSFLTVAELCRLIEFIKKSYARDGKIQPNSLADFFLEQDIDLGDMDDSLDSIIRIRSIFDVVINPQQ